MHSTCAAAGSMAVGASGHVRPGVKLPVLLKASEYLKEIVQAQVMSCRWDRAFSRFWLSCRMSMCARKRHADEYQTVDERIWTCMHCWRQLPCTKRQFALRHRHGHCSDRLRASSAGVLGQVGSLAGCLIGRLRRARFPASREAEISVGKVSHACATSACSAHARVRAHTTSTHVHMQNISPSSLLFVHALGIENLPVSTGAVGVLESLARPAVVDVNAVLGCVARGWHIAPGVAAPPLQS